MSRNFHRVLLLFSCTFIGLINGTLYLYSSYSPQLASNLNYSVSESSIIALSGSLGLAIAGPIAGIIVDKKGYTSALLIGGLSIIFAYIGLKNQFDNKWSSVEFSSVCLFLVGSGSTFVNSACLKCSAVSFPSIRATAASLSLALYGLSAMFYSVIASVFYPGDTSGFFGFLVLSIILIFLTCFPSIYLADCEHKLKNASNFPKPKASTPVPQGSASSDSTLALFMDYRFWLLFIITGALASLGQMYIYSVGYIVKAILSKATTAKSDFDALSILIQQEQQYQVGLLSIANCFGRLSAGIFGDIVTQSFHKPKTLLLFIPALGMTTCQVLAYGITGCSELQVNSFLTGYFYGFTFCIMPIITGDVFGMPRFSFNWGVIAMSPIPLSYYFTKLFGKVYDLNSVVNRTISGDSLVCTLGNKCYNSIFHITLGVSIVATIIVLVLNAGDLVCRRRKITSLPLASPSNLFNEKVN